MLTAWEKRYWIWKEAQARAQSDVWTDPRGYCFLNIVSVTLSGSTDRLSTFSPSNAAQHPMAIVQTR